MIFYLCPASSYVFSCHQFLYLNSSPERHGLLSVVLNFSLYGCMKLRKSFPQKLLVRTRNISQNICILLSLKYFIQRFAASITMSATDYLMCPCELITSFLLWEHLWRAVSRVVSTL